MRFRSDCPVLALRAPLPTNFTLLNIPLPNADIMSAFYQKPIVDEHLSKPVDLATLEQVVKRFRVIPPANT